MHASPVFAAPDDEFPSYEETTPRAHSLGESMLYVGSLYVLTLPVYLYISRDEVFNNASLQGYMSNFGSVTIFDQDLPGANWGVHFVTGAFTYEFYRDRSYSKSDAFFMTLLQEALFQFTVETGFAPTGLENILNTAVIGSILGRGLELSSNWMLNSRSSIVRTVGYVLNPPAILGLHEGKVKVVPLLAPGAAGAAVKVEF